ncbi:MAG: hypothetical protein Ct9H300mP29_3520 [Candidatus Neomarinimicrobiota bacterium]|nr:MAG: hypothetical protein Ct9H300mP29_3520 [Candidatus Neomarinimicrobiota bacterium]
MKKLTSLLIVALFATIGCEKLMKEDILLDDPELRALFLMVWVLISV